MMSTKSDLVRENAWTLSYNSAQGGINVRVRGSEGGRITYDQLGCLHMMEEEAGWLRGKLC